MHTADDVRERTTFLPTGVELRFRPLTASLCVRLPSDFSVHAGEDALLGRPCSGKMMAQSEIALPIDVKLLAEEWLRLDQVSLYIPIQMLERD